MLANREIRSMHEVEVDGEWKTIRSFFKERDRFNAPETQILEAIPTEATSNPAPLAAEPQNPKPPVPPEQKTAPSPRPVPPELPSESTIRESAEKESAAKESMDSVPEFVSREAEDALGANPAPREKKDSTPKLKKSLLPKPDISDKVMKQTRAGEFLVHGGFWYRVLAMLADLVIVYALPLIILGWLFQTDLPPQNPITVFREIFALGPLGVALLTLASVLIWIYFASMESSRKRGTIGKKIFGLVVTDELGNRVSFQRASLRFFSKLLSAVIVFAGFFLAAFTRRKQGLHDLISRCTVNHSLPPSRLLRRTPDRTLS